MKYFLLTFFAVYGGAHLYAFKRMRPALPAGTHWSILLALFMTLMVASPVLVRVAEGRGMTALAYFGAWTGYCWMGFLFLFFSLSLAFDAVRLAAAASKAWGGRELFLTAFPARRLSLLLVALAALVSLYASLEARDIRLEEVTVKTDKMDRTAGPLTLVQISDVHVGLIVRAARLEAIAAAVRRAKPDLLVSTGDLLDGQPDRLDGLSGLLEKIRPRYGKFAVTGNHEYYAGIDESLAFTRKAGFTVLRGEGVDVGGLLTVAGVDDRTGRAFGEGAGASERDLLARFPRERFTVLLKHRPVVDDGACGLVDLQLSGHTHKGQIFPFGLLTRLVFPLNSGTAKGKGGCLVHVSRGSGTWGPPMRLLSPPEVTVVRIEGTR